MKLTRLMKLTPKVVVFCFFSFFSLVQPPWNGAGIRITVLLYALLCLKMLGFLHDAVLLLFLADVSAFLYMC
jgi:hypothetical protein